MKSFCSLALVFALLLLTAGCGVINYLDIAVKATEAALPIIAAATGMSPQLTQSLETYVADADQALQLAAQEQGSTDTDQVKAAKILAFFAGLNIPNLNGAPSPVVSIIQTIAGDIANYLATYKTISAATTTTPSYTLKPSVAQRMTIEKIRTRALANREKAKAKRP
jgi:hypothetical protein